LFAKRLYFISILVFTHFNQKEMIENRYDIIIRLNSLYLANANFQVPELPSLVAELSV